MAVIKIKSGQEVATPIRSVMLEDVKTFAVALTATNISNSYKTAKPIRKIIADRLLSSITLIIKKYERILILLPLHLVSNVSEY